jgi:hypothetical protein
VATAEGYSTYAAAARKIFRQQLPETKRATQKLIEASRM